MAPEPMTAGLVWLAALGLLPLAGAPLLAHAAYRGLPAGTRVVLAGASGAVFASFAMTLCACIGVAWNVPLVLLGAAALAFAARRILRRAPASAPRAPEPLSAASLLGAFLSLLAVLVALSATLRGAASSIDLLLFWGPKAQQFAIARTVDVAFLRSEYLQYMHPYYPPLVTNLGAFASIAAGGLSWTAATLTFPILLATLAAGLPGLLRARGPRAASSAASALIASSVGALGIASGIAGNAEMPLLLLETLAAALLLIPDPDRVYAILAGVLLAGVSTAKVEGLPFALAATVLAIVLAGEGLRAAAPRALLLLGPSAAALGTWFAFGATRRIFLGYGGQGSLLDFHAGQWRIVLRSIEAALAGAGRGLPFLIPLACLLPLLPRLDRTSALPIGTAAALTGFLLFTYLDRPGDPSQWISWSAARVCSPLIVLTVLAMTCVARDEQGPPRTPQPSRG